MFRLLRFNESFDQPYFAIIECNSFKSLKKFVGFIKATIAYFSLSKFGYAAITFYPYIIIAKNSDFTIIRMHESVHIIQQAFTRFFYLKYFFSYLLNLFRYFNHDKAYRNIPYEKEAYKLQNDPYDLKAYYADHGISDPNRFYNSLINAR